MKNKVINDPVHGFIAINDQLVLRIINHSYFQRLRRIKQLGQTDYVYPGAVHTRFHHALGSYHLMCKAVQTLQNKGIEISQEEALSVKCAILLHDIGHGPFSHTLEHTLMQGVNHEEISLQIMHALNAEFNGALDLTIKIFTNNYHKKFLYQLVSSQLDVDRLDYLSRDSYFTGVSEGVINYNRIIDMMYVYDNELVVEAKGIYSIEKFLISRRLMYWQVYLHKTVICVEEMLIKTIERAQYLFKKGISLDIQSPLLDFMDDSKSFDQHFLAKFLQLDDNDIIIAIKKWQFHNDRILSFLAKCIINRNLFKIKIQEKAFADNKIAKLKEAYNKKFEIANEDADFLIINKKITSYLYHPEDNIIKIINKKGKIIDFAKASDQWSALAIQKPVTKYFFCYYDL